MNGIVLQRQLFANNDEKIILDTYVFYSTLKYTFMHTSFQNYSLFDQSDAISSNSTWRLIANSFTNGIFTSKRGIDQDVSQWSFPRIRKATKKNCKCDKTSSYYILL